MPLKDLLHRLLFNREGLLTPTGSTPSLAIISPHRSTVHIRFPPALSTPSPPSPAFVGGLRDSLEGTVAISRRHLVIHDPSLCGSSMRCDLREKNCSARWPGISAEVLNIPRAHVVASSRTPEPYDLGAMWARPLSTGIRVGAGDRVWVDGLGEVVLFEDEDGSSVTALSPFWGFFRAQTVYHGVIHVAIEWQYIELTPEEYELRVSTLSRVGGWMCLGGSVGFLVKRMFRRGGGGWWV